MFLELRKSIANIIYREGENERRALERAANTDALTGLANRRAFDLATATATDDPETSFILIDVNNFKTLNDTKGHKKGDGVLQLVAEAILLAAGLYDLKARCFRIGGDEFAIIAPAAVARELAFMVEMEFGQMQLDGGYILSISAGDGDTYESADLELYARKSARKQKEYVN